MIVIVIKISARIFTLLDPDPHLESAFWNADSGCGFRRPNSCGSMRMRISNTVKFIEKAECKMYISDNKKIFARISGPMGRVSNNNFPLNCFNSWRQKMSTPSSSAADPQSFLIRPKISQWIHSLFLVNYGNRSRNIDENLLPLHENSYIKYIILLYGTRHFCSRLLLLISWKF